MNEFFENKIRFFEEDLEVIMKVLKIGKVELLGVEEDLYGYNYRRRRFVGFFLFLLLELKIFYFVYRREVDDYVDVYFYEIGIVRNIVIDLFFNF